MFLSCRRSVRMGRQDALEEAAACLRVRSVGDLAQDHSMPDHLLGGVVRWLDALDPHEGPERVGVPSKNGSSFGRSNTWSRRGLGSRPSSPRWHFSQRMGRQAMIERAFSDGSSGRARRVCPGCPPGFRPLGGLFGRGAVAGPSLDGAFDELRDDLPSASFSARTSA